MKKGWWKAAVLGAVLTAMPVVMIGHVTRWGCSEVKAAAVVHEEKGKFGLLVWPQNLNAVRSEVEIFAEAPVNLSDDAPFEGAMYRNGQIYSNRVILDMTKLPEGVPLFWRVRAFDLDGNPVTPYSQPAELSGALIRTDRNAPIPHPRPVGKHGTTLLFPVYAYTGNPGASRYEIEVTDAYPENENGFAPSVHRIYANHTELTDLYDELPRVGNFFWRVRGLDAAGMPVGEWSLPQQMYTPTDGWEVAIYGDSISHGGGHLSFSPVDYAYSYETYLSFDSINLSDSGNTSEMMVDRFARDVLPFHPKYLLIMGGTNSLRAGIPAASVIADLQEMQRMARENGITPVLLTLPPINGDNIRKAFDEPTYEGWKKSFREVNDFIRGEVHIDTAAPFEAMEDLPTWLALDGIHGDWNMKQMMADVINREFPLIRK